MNAKEELIKDLEGAEVFAAIVECHGKTFLLKCRHSQEDWLHFLEQLNFEYENGYGSQELDGTVWLWDGTWLERGEYDGSEWWDHRVLPELPEKLK